MKPIDYRNATFETIKDYLTGDRLRVLEGYRTHGPCTTRALSNTMPMSILTVRPRTTELVQLGFLVCILQSNIDPRQGVYAAVPEADARAEFEKTKREACANAQMQLSL